MKKAVLVLIIIVGIFNSSQLAVAQTATNTFTKDGNTYVVTKTVSEGKVTIETKIYDSSGNLINTKVVEKDAKPTPVKEIKEYPLKNITPTVSKPIPTKQIEPIATPVPDTLPKTQETILENTTYALQSDLPLSINEESGNIMVQAESGQIEVKTKPEEVVEKAYSQGLDLIDELKIVAGSNGLKYVIKGNKQEKFLAIIKVNLPTSLTYTTDTGELEKVDQTLAVKLTDLLSL